MHRGLWWWSMSGPSPECSFFLKQTLKSSAELINSKIKSGSGEGGGRREWVKLFLHYFFLSFIFIWEGIKKDIFFFIKCKKYQLNLFYFGWKIYIYSDIIIINMEIKEKRKKESNFNIILAFDQIFFFRINHFTDHCSQSSLINCKHLCYFLSFSLFFFITINIFQNHRLLGCAVFLGYVRF